VTTNQLIEADVKSRWSALLWLTVVMFGASCSRAEKTTSDEPSTPHSLGDTMRVQLVDGMTARPIAGAKVKLHSDNGVRCIKAPCPTNEKQWTGVSDGNGRIAIPRSVLDVNSNLTSGVYQGDLVAGAWPGSNGESTLELFADTADVPLHPLKLVDARMHRVIANTPVRIESSEGVDGASLTSTTNLLGYVLLPADFGENETASSWIIAPGYRKTRVVAPWALRSVLLEPE
jgi:hypothetical protein